MSRQRTRVVRIAVLTSLVVLVGTWAPAHAHAPTSTTREVNTAILTTRVLCLDITVPSCPGRLEFVSPPGALRHAGAIIGSALPHRSGRRRRRRSGRRRGWGRRRGGGLPHV